MCIVENLKTEYKMKMATKEMELVELENKVAEKRVEYQNVAQRLDSNEAELAAALHHNTELTSLLEDVSTGISAVWHEHMLLALCGLHKMEGVETITGLALPDDAVYLELYLLYYALIVVT